MAKAVGIDLGTTNSVIAVMEGGKPVVLENAEGERTTPSVVAFKEGETLVGRMAKRQAVLNPLGTIFEVKRFIGRRWDEVKEEAARVPYNVEEGPDGGVRIRVGDKRYTPEEISAMVLRKLVDDASAKLGQKVTKAVITVPAYFNNSQREATANAGRIAGLEVLRIINEPTAASLAYGLDKKESETVLVFDLGGGTFDVTVLEIGEGVFEVKSTSGDTHLGGSDMDHAIVNWLAEEFKREHGVDLKADRQALQRLIEAAEKAKIELSSTTETTISLPFIALDPASKTPLHLEKKLTRAKFEELIQPLLHRLRTPVEQALKDAGLSANQIDEVILVGGATRVPAVQRVVKEIIGKEPNRSVNPDEVVALGAAVQAGVLMGEVEDVVLLDVTPLSLGVETKGGVMTVLIPRNTTIPTRKTEVFTTAEHNQTAVEIHVLQGERPMAQDNKSLGRFRLEGIPPMPAGVPQIEVTFDIDANGILHVTAKEKSTGKEASIRIENTTTLSEEEIQRMIEEAQKHAEEDRRRKEHIELKNNLDTARIQAERIMQEKEASPEVKSRLEAAVQKAKELVEKDAEDAELRQATEELLSALQAYEQAAQGQGATAASGASDKKDDDVIDADYKPAE
ncbi:molecular chaperone DnaK [Marinithermus hydrothermalis]|uniref:Chaperone protein DnaK n=1 Tax=Marinithermus hydrothermalis (strain DSM 14884 / JCM 11576 / T1) TaxID=869210 RepID=F2NKZ4_MARHT|nr:molecular chaperone DnaK [Marinithermus hydrothermalis]AEB11183.1 Chaperone protein dnaK [Marinithermus hydrothermalis DSM 14884]